MVGRAEGVYTTRRVVCHMISRRRENRSGVKRRDDTGGVFGVNGSTRGAEAAVPRGVLWSAGPMSRLDTAVGEKFRPSARALESLTSLLA